MAYLVALAVRNAGDAVYELTDAVVRLIVGDLSVDLAMAPGSVTVVDDTEAPAATLRVSQADSLALISGERPGPPQVDGDASAADQLLGVLTSGMPSSRRRSRGTDRYRRNQSRSRK